MKHFLLWSVLLGLAFPVNAQQLKNDRLPDKIYGEWFAPAGKSEYNGILIRPDFIEYFYQACRYDEIRHRDSLYLIRAVMDRGDTITFSVQFLAEDTIRMVRPGGQVVIYGRVKEPHNSKKLSADGIPDFLRHSWYTTDGKNTLQFDLSGDTLSFRHKKYKLIDIIHFNHPWGEEYRFTGVNEEGKAMMFYFKKWSEGYTLVGYYGQYGNLYKSDSDYPNVRTSDPAGFVRTFGGQWFTTDGKNEERMSYGHGTLVIGGKPCKMQSITKNKDGFSLHLSAGQTDKWIDLKKDGKDHILFAEKGQRPVILKHRPADKNYVPEELPDTLAGAWYTTDGKNEEAVSLAPALVLIGKQKIKNPLFGKTSTGLAIMNPKEKILAEITMVTPTHIEIRDKKGERNIYKRSPETGDTMFIAPAALPPYLKGNWFGTDGSEYWAFGIHDKFLIADNAFWNYRNIIYKDNTFTIDAKNGGHLNRYVFRPVGNDLWEVSKNNASFRKYTLDRTRAVYRPQNRYGSRNTHDVFIQGYIHPVTAGTPRTFQFVVNNIIYNDQLTYIASIDDDGRFEITIPKFYGQDIYLIHKNLVTLFVHPGDSLLIIYDPADIENTILFMGDDADACHDMNLWDKKQHAIARKEAYADQSHIKKDSCSVYKAYKTKQHEEELQRAGKFQKEHELSRNFSKWLKDETTYDYLNSLMRYRWMHPMSLGINPFFFKLPDSCFSFVYRYPVDLNKEIISSSFGDYVYELEMYFTHRMHETDTLNAITFTPTHMLEILAEKMDSFPPEIGKIRTRLQEGKKLDEKETTILNAFFNEQKNMITYLQRDIFMKREEAYFKKIPIPGLLTFHTAQHLNYQIENTDTTYLKIIVPEALDRLGNEKFRDGLELKYQQLLAELRKPFYIDSLLTKETTTSGDSLLLKIVHKHKGKVIYLDFWATWCGPCRDEMPYSLELQKRLKDRDVAFVYLCSSSSPEKKWEEFIKQMKLTGDHYYVNRDAWNELGGMFGISGIPHYVLIDRDGKVVSKNAKRPSNGEALIMEIEKLLQ